MAKVRALGKGLGALIPDRVPSAGGEDGGVRVVTIEHILPNPYQPRVAFSEEALEELAESIRLHGVLQPVLVRPRGGEIELIAGERRLRAAKLAGLTEIPVVLRECTDHELMEIALVENLQRADLNPMEEAVAFSRLVGEFGWTQEEVAARVGRSRSQVANYLRLLQLEIEIQNWIRQGLLSVAHAKVLLSLELNRVNWAEKALNNGWTVRQLEAAVQHKDIPERSIAQPDVHFRLAESRLRRKFGTRVVLRGSAAHGKIEIPYRGLGELERLLELLETVEGDGEPGGDGGAFTI